MRKSVRKTMQKVGLKLGIHSNRSMILFEESIKSIHTKNLYILNLKRFMKFANIKSTNDLASCSTDQLQIMFEDYLIKLKNTVNPNSIPVKFTGLKHFCIMNRKNIDWDIIHKLFPEKQKRTGHKPWTTRDIQSMLKNTTSIRTKALIHFLASTGSRIGVFDYDLKFKHTKKMTDGCTAIKIYAEHIDEYWSFLTPQSTNALNLYCKYRINRGELITRNSPLFVNYNLKMPITSRAVKNVIFDIIRKSHVNRKLEGNRYNIQMNHGFRKRFNTILKLNNHINYNIAEKLMGHKNGLDGVYFIPTLNEIFIEFRKAIDDLEIKLP